MVRNRRNRLVRCRMLTLILDEPFMSWMIGSELLSDSSSKSDWTIGLFFGRPAVIVAELAGIYKSDETPQE